MSRELLGDSPDDAAADATTDLITDVITEGTTDGDVNDGDVTDDSTGRPSRWRSLSRRGRAGVLTAAAVLAGGTAWSTPDLAAALAPDLPPPAVVVWAGEVTQLAVAQGRHHLSMSVDITNLGTQPIELDGVAATPSAVRVEPTEAPAVRVAPHATLSWLLDLTVDCADPSPLVLPPLRLRDPTGSAFERHVTGSSQVLFDSCLNGDVPSGIGVAFGRLARSGDHLLVPLQTDGTRPFRVVGVAAGGLTLRAKPLPLHLTTTAYPVDLTPPLDCPSGWDGTGPPDALDLTLAGDTLTGTSAAPDSTDSRQPLVDRLDDVHVRVPVGLSLTAWLLQVGCRGGAS